MCNKRLGIYLVLFSPLYFTTVFSMNLVVFYDTFLRPVTWQDSRFCFALKGQTGFSTQSFDECGFVSNVLRIWNKDQNAIKMLDGFRQETPIGQLRSAIDANDDGIRGHFLVCGDLDVKVASEFSFWYYFLNDFSISFHLPFYVMELKNVTWQEQTQSLNADDFRVKEYLTNDFTNNVRNLGCLDVCGWNRKGVGDLLLLFEWMRNFKQSKKFLKNVRLSGRLGLTLPTGKRVDEDKIFAFSFGNDGATGALVGGGIDLTFGSYMKAGLDVQILHAFGNTKCRRIKTDCDQTELLLLQKVDAFKEHGLRQRFNLYLEAFNLRGASLKAGYQFIRHADDFLYIRSNEFSNAIANSAESLQEWTMHSFIFNVSYDFFNKEVGERRVHPYVSLFAKIPFNGMRVAMERTVGAMLSIDF